MNSTWSVDWLLAVSTANTELVRTASYVALAGVISLLLCLLLLASINTCITCRNPGRTETPPCLDSIAEFSRVADLCSPYHTTHLHPACHSSSKPGRKSSGSDGYAKPFHPGRGVSLSEHYVSVDMERNDGHSPVLTTGASHRGSTWYDTDIVVRGNPQSSCTT
ncbi:uncharacterized protein LOC124257048 isoform X2 [Haliotis rubra]|uniref:uncharacterized protein LOC124257048 isoform X2 n=1 Tax=Haliotis rubra TaxID=36100 RepID=UPI001EE56FC0|nr:uncharacterized protein LOC124257048 isoform X2 [Haliotis rubra]